MSHRIAAEQIMIAAHHNTHGGCTAVRNQDGTLVLARAGYAVATRSWATAARIGRIGPHIRPYDIAPELLRGTFPSLGGLRRPRGAVGTWYDKRTSESEVSEAMVVNDLAIAHQIARKHGEAYIWDLANNALIKTERI